MFDPELANALVPVREGEAISGLGMRETRGIEIEAQPMRLRPADPVLEVRDFDLVAIHFPAPKLAIHRVKVDAMLARDEGKGLLQVGPQFIRRACLAGIVARDRKSTAQRAAKILESADVVSLPAVERNWNLGKSLKGVIHIHAQSGVAFTGKNKGGDHVSRC